MLANIFNMLEENCRTWPTPDSEQRNFDLSQALHYVFDGS
jgi:hypothetical protein